MSRLEKIANWLSVLAAFAFAGAVVLPDTTIGSPRSIVMSIAGVVVAVVQLLHALSAVEFHKKLARRVFDCLMEIDYPRTERGGVNAPETPTSPA
jgi:protein-S-isoprenylcysteine O-methyltransferase Ste14